MPHPDQSLAGLPPQDGAVNGFTGHEMGMGGLSAAGGPPGADLSAGPDPRDVEFGGEPEQMGLSNLADLHRDAVKEQAKQGRRDTREARRERRRMALGLADAEMMAEVAAAGEPSSDWDPRIREYMARAGMPNPEQAITDQYHNVTSAGQRGLDEVLSLGDRGATAAMGAMDRGLRAAGESADELSPTIRQYMARAGMSNPEQTITDQYDNVTSAGQKGLDRVLSLGKRGATQGLADAEMLMEMMQFGD